LDFSTFQACSAVIAIRAMLAARVSILDRILTVKRDEVARAKRLRSLEEVEIAANAAGPVRPFADALRRPAGEAVRVLAEIKRASPSAGPIRVDADPAEIAREYAGNGAAAISVLTDEQFFDGKLEFLARVRAACSLPLLRKDFIVDSYQIAEARAAGADAILLIVAALDEAQLIEFLGTAAGYNLDALVEVHTMEEAELALEIGATLLGVNHRNLKNMTIDMSLTSMIAPRVPAGTVLVGESGIRTAADIRELGRAGAHAVLIGEHLMRALSPGDALRELLEGVQ
jgi:indole-3-glycerol phosphate synthase